MTVIQRFVAWEQRKLGEVFNQTVNYIDPKEADLELWSVTVENGLTPKTERYNREALVKKKDKFKAVLPGDIVYNPMNMTIGSVGFNRSDKRVAVSGYYVTMNMNAGFSNSYFSTWLPSFKAIQIYKRYATGSLIEKQRVQFPILSKIKTQLPLFEEQEKIGSFFKKLDNTIALHQEKLKGLCALKKAYSQGIFPRKRESTPRVRFANFKSEWENCKLGDLAEIVGGGTPSTKNPEYWNGGLDWYSPVELGERVYLNGSQKKITKIGLQKSSAKLLPVGTVLFTSRAGIGNTAILGKEGATNQGFQSIVPRKEYLDSYFIYSRAIELKRYGERTGAGSTFVEVSGKQMSKMSLRTPALEEQKKIGMFFQSLDKIIDLQKRKIDILNKLKKSYLNNMFV